MPAASRSLMNAPQVTITTPTRTVTKDQARTKAIKIKMVVAREVPKARIPKAAISRVVIQRPKEATRKENSHLINRVIRVEADNNLEIRKEKMGIVSRRMEARTLTILETKARATKLPRTAVPTEVVRRKIRVGNPMIPKILPMDQRQATEAKVKTMVIKTGKILRMNTTQIRATNQVRPLINSQLTSLRLIKMVAMGNRTNRVRNMMGKHSKEYETI